MVIYFLILVKLSRILKILTEELIPKMEDVKVEVIGDMADSEILINI